jgi:hypothetical protein
MKTRKVYTQQEFRDVWRVGVAWTARDDRELANRIANSTEALERTMPPTWSAPFYVAEIAEVEKGQPDEIKAPSHYYCTVKGVEIDCWDVEEQLGMRKEHFIASAFAYLWRCLHKGDTLKDLKKARAYLDREIAHREKNNG